jgi:hypothetical protein
MTNHSITYYVRYPTGRTKLPDGTGEYEAEKEMWKLRKTYDWVALDRIEQVTILDTQEVENQNGRI